MGAVEVQSIVMAVTAGRDCAQSGDYSAGVTYYENAVDLTSRCGGSQRRKPLIGLGVTCSLSYMGRAAYVLADVVGRDTVFGPACEGLGSSLECARCVC